MSETVPPAAAPQLATATPDESVDRRLALDLDVLRWALGGYLVQLRALWSVADGAMSTASPLGRSATEVDRLVAAVGFVPSPDREAPALRSAVRAARAESEGPLARVVSSLGLDMGHELIVAAAWWSEADPQFAVTLGCAHDDASRRFASAALLRLVMAPYGVAIPAVLEDSGPLVRGGMLVAGAGASGPLRLTPTALQVLAGLPRRALAESAELPPRFGRAVAALARHLGTDGAEPVVLRGAAAPDGIRLATAAARAAGRVPVGEDRPVAELRLLARAAGAVAVIAGGDAVEWGPDDGPLVVVDPPVGQAAIVSDALAGGGDTEAAGGRRPAVAARVEGASVHVVVVPRPDTAERSAHWLAVLQRAGMPCPAAADLAEAVAGRFGFAESEIEAVVAAAVTSARWSGRRIDADAVWAAARGRPSRVLDRLASIVTPVFTLDDLVLPDDTRAQLDELLDHVALQQVVLDQWGFRRRLPRGQGVAALLAGPPGTGKTMACEALAQALHQDLYLIDLSAVVSKYIGETEKHLAAAFSEAERAGAVLFFDEADSLFGRRTEVKDAHDRYANLEVNFLLQRVETFTGLVLLASNRRSALDDAFVRRLRFVIPFAMPGPSARRELWRRAFPPEAEVSGVDFDQLAGAELSGAAIQGAALAAAFLAAKAGTAVTEAHVVVALRRQYEKLSKSWAGLPARVNEGGR